MKIFTEWLKWLRKSKCKKENKIVGKLIKKDGELYYFFD